MINNMKIITIAIPVYNVEKYIARCLDSIVNQVQKFTDEIEVLLVDDGSTDNSLRICETYKEKYSFIRIIHQGNHGLAYVRNVCIDNAQGAYISFIDSDDYILDGLYSYAISLLNEYQYDILCFRHLDIYDEEHKMPTMKNFKKPILNKFTSKQALDMMFFDKYIDVITCNKIIKKSLFNGIEYPVGKLYEDMFTTYKYIAKASLVLSTDIPFYVYCHRSGSIGQCKFNEKSMDLYYAAKESYNFICKECDHHDLADVGFVYWVVVVANMMIKANHNDYEFLRYTQSLLCQYKAEIMACDLLSHIKKIEFILLGTNLSVYRVLYKVYLKLRRNKVR